MKTCPVAWSTATPDNPPYPGFSFWSSAAVMACQSCAVPVEGTSTKSAARIVYRIDRSSERIWFSAPFGLKDGRGPSCTGFRQATELFLDADAEEPLAALQEE